MWSLKEGNKSLKPKVFSNGKNQEDIVKEVLTAIDNGNRVIFIHGVCGSGKSAIALNIAKELGKSSIVVPIKTLQKQYEEDYMSKKQVFKKDGNKLNISMITGRNNHPCLYLKDNKQEIRDTRKKEIDSKLFDIFKQSKEPKQICYDESADNYLIPCKIEIKEKNFQTLKKYYRENPNKKDLKNLDLKYMRRFAVGPACPYWSPIIPSSLKVSLEADEKKYLSINDEQTIYLRHKGCPYYNQFLSYKNADVIIFNSMQYLLESGLGRKPATEVEIIDECDEFLDNLAAEGTINFNKLRNESTFLYSSAPENEKLIAALNELIGESYDECKSHSKTEKIFPLNETKIKELVKLFTKNDFFSITQDEDSYIEKTSEMCKKFEGFLDEAYVSFYKVRDREEYGVKLVTINLDKVFNSLLDKNKVFVMMSGTLHSEKVLKEIFGIENYKIVNAETINQGNIARVKTGLEDDFRYENFKRNLLTREDFLRSLELCVGMAKRPTIIHVNAFRDLPSEKEIQDFNLKNLISSEELLEKQKQDKQGIEVQNFKDGKRDILFTTKCSRGIDFPYETCNSVVITKFPYPNTQSLFWQILKKQKPAYFWDFYMDKAHRDLLQKIYRSVRAKDDHVDLFSPDIRVLQADLT